ncbi:MAG: AAA family ATPase [Aphanizomenon gracile PMC627.10]|uniref:AAA family ATPase n=1 Tax=Dolichospermum sp. LEGE 00240 TaxID=1828603 RepID=UPI001D14C4A2|nr:AAA family ATPase [Dolichospermum sp. LEGE 00240]MDM3850424.1 AAA family ATPase [Aphanizomenon gracile PMC627.10]
MLNNLNHLHIKNFRSLADVHISPDSLNILFGPNGAGKSTFLDTIWFIRDCAIRGVDSASSFRDHGIGILWDGASETDNILIEIEDESTKYEVSFGLSSGRIEAFAGEKLINKINNQLLINRTIGSDKATFYQFMGEDETTITLREPEKLALTSYVAFGKGDGTASELDRLLRAARSYHLRGASLFNLRRAGSESEPGDRLQDRCENLWSVLRNLHDRQVIDDRYDTIMKFMRESFPAFDGLYFEQTGRNTVYANFLDKRRRKPIQASGVSDGYIQMLINLTALFSEKPNGYSLILLDEPDISLHPWALAVFGKAVKLATEKLNKQVFIATHSPVLISQFEPQNIWATELDKNGQTVMKRVSEITDIQDLLEEYATGSLYMAEMIAPQSQSDAEELSQ